MPNHITNKFIEISSDETFEKLVLNKEGQVDFSILLPMPEALDITSRGTFDRYLQLIFQNSEEFMKAVNEDNLEEAIKIGKEIGFQYTSQYGHKNNADENDVKEFINKRKYGYGTWYDWNVANWGTKWNAYDQCPPHEFNTAWSNPTLWLNELGKHMDFVLTYADEDTGNNYGFVIAVNGTVQEIDCVNLIDDKFTSMAIAMHIRDAESDYFKEYLEECYSDELSEEEIQKIVDSEPEAIKKFYAIIDEYKEMYCKDGKNTLHETGLFSR
jgi:hypothetical protein